MQADQKEKELMVTPCYFCNKDKTCGGGYLECKKWKNTFRRNWHIMQERWGVKPTKRGKM